MNSAAHLEIPSIPEKPASFRSKFADYLTLTKPEITFLVTISAVAGYILGTTGEIDLSAFIALIVGVAFSSAGGAAFNHYIERDLDAEMKRTDNRPLPSGRINPTVVLVLASLISITGIGILYIYCNLLTSILSALTIVLYIFLYTPLKQYTKYNTFVGTIPGALPALGGWTAATGSFGTGGWVIFFILLIWQLPHFLALAWMYRKDYGRAGFKMLPVVEPNGRSTANQMLISAVLLLITSLLPSALGLTGMIYFIGVLIVSLWLLATCVRFYRTMTNVDARRVLKASIIHIPVLVVLLIVDRLI
ncbi:MAG: heme o synthase [Rhodothermales bacterium]